MASMSTPSANSVQTAPTQRKARKGKEKAISSRASTPRPAAPQIQLPPADRPCPPNFLRNQRALLGLAGLVGGLNPKQLSVPRGSSAHNPIVIDDSDTSVAAGPLTSQPQSISRHPAPAPVGPGQLSPPNGEEILASLIRSGNLLPVVQSLVRLLSGPAPNAPAPPRLPTRTGWEHPSPNSAPPLKRRKLNNVPAGATDWDVPYPFQEGQGPQGYEATWAQQRARALLADLVGLIQGAAKKVAVKGYYQQQERERKRKWAEEGIIRGYYRARTATYGLELDRATSQRPSQLGITTSMTSSNFPQSSFVPQMSQTRQTMSEPPSQLMQPPSVQIAQPERSSTPEEATPLLAQESSTSFDDWVASLLAPSDAQSHPSDASLTNEQFAGLDLPSYFDDWLSLLNTFPPGDPNDGESHTTFDDTLNALASISGPVPSDSAHIPALISSPTTSSVTSPSVVSPQASSLASVFALTDTQSHPALQALDSAFNIAAPVDSIPDHLIDPALLAIHNNSNEASPERGPSVPSSSNALLDAMSATPTDSTFDELFGAGEGVAPVVGNEADAMTTSNMLSTPMLTSPLSGSASPLASTMSLADRDPATPDWSWAFGDPGVAGVPSEAAEPHGGVIANLGIDAADLRALEMELEQVCGSMDILPQLSESSQLETNMQVVSEAGTDTKVDVGDGSHAMRLDPLVLEPPCTDASKLQPTKLSPVVPVALRTATSSFALPEQARSVQSPDASQVSTSDCAVVQPSLPSSRPPPDMANEDGLPPPARIQTDTGYYTGAVVDAQPTASMHPALRDLQADQTDGLLHAHSPIVQSASCVPTQSESSAVPSADPAIAGPSSVHSPPASTPGLMLSSLLALASPSFASTFHHGATQKTLTKAPRAQLLTRARALKGELERARERARIELWEMTMEMGGLVAVGKELDAMNKQQL